MTACCSGACAAIEGKFGPKVARRDLLHYRKKGPGPTARLLRDGVLAAGGPGETLLDIGAGIGPLTFELLERGVRRAVSVDASTAYIEAGREEAARRNRSEHVSWVHGDFVAIAPSLEPADTVTLDRVVCCYPEFEPLLTEAAKHARRRLAISYPRGTRFVRLGLAAENALRALKGDAFRTFVHPPQAMEQLIRRQGFELYARRQTLIWSADIFSRSHDAAGRDPTLSRRR